MTSTLATLTKCSNQFNLNLKRRSTKYWTLKCHEILHTCTFEASHVLLKSKFFNWEVFLCDRLKDWEFAESLNNNIAVRRNFNSFQISIHKHFNVNLRSILASMYSNSDSVWLLNTHCKTSKVFWNFQSQSLKDLN